MSLEMLGIEKSFGASPVLKGVDFSVADGEIRALLGENGAGKTTLMNVLGGVIQADAGRIHLNGKEVHFATPRQSQDGTNRTSAEPAFSRIKPINVSSKQITLEITPASVVTLGTAPWPFT